MATSNSRIHELYHEAQRRTSGAQTPIKYKQTRSLLLPAPNNVIFEVFNTIIKDTPAQAVLDYVRNHLKVYLESNWSHSVVQQTIKRLRREQLIDTKAGVAGLPQISKLAKHQNDEQKTKSLPKHDSIKQSLVNAQQQVKSPTRTGSHPAETTKRLSEEKINFQANLIAKQVTEHVLWRIATQNVTQITSLLIKIVVDDGYKQNILKSEAFTDVAQCFEDWRGQKLIKLYAFGCAPAGDQKLALSSTTSGDLTKWIANFIDGSDKSRDSRLLPRLASSLRDKTRNCIYVTHNLTDALQSIDSFAVRCAILVDRLDQHQQWLLLPNYKSHIEPQIIIGRLYIVSSLDCVEFAPDPTAPACC